MPMEQDVRQYEEVEIGRVYGKHYTCAAPLYYSHSHSSNWFSGNTLLMRFEPYYYEEQTYEILLEGNK